VVIADYAYGPATLTVPLGTTVTWTNEDTAPHDVQTSSGPVTLDSPMLQEGDEWSFTFTTAGTYDYYCTVHPDMVARVVVEQPPPAPEPEPTTAEPEPEPEPTTAEPEPEPEPTTDEHGDHDHEHEPAEETPTATANESEPASASPTPETTDDATPAPTPTPTLIATDPAASGSEELDPLLIVTGVAAGVAVLCLLLAASRSAAARRR
jgi:amicyanin